MAQSAKERLQALDKIRIENQQAIDRLAPGSPEHRQRVERQVELNAQRAPLLRSSQMETTVESGVETGKRLVPEMSLGRLGDVAASEFGSATGPQAEAFRAASGPNAEAFRGISEERSADVADIIARRRAGLAGLSSEELQAERDIAAENIGRATETARRRLQSSQARAGVRGGTAGAQIGDVLNVGQEQRRGFERDLFLKQADVRRQALGDFEQTIGAAEARAREAQLFNIQQSQLQDAAQRETERFNLQQAQALDAAQRETERFNLQQRRLLGQSQRAVEQFNLQQAAAEKFAALSTGLGLTQLGISQEAGQQAIEAQLQAASLQSQSCFDVNTEILMKNGSYKKIKDIEIDDETAGGVVVSKIYSKSNDIYDYNGTFVAGNHAVLDNGEWKRVKDCQSALHLNSPKSISVINLVTTDHKIFTKEDVFADQIENFHTAVISDHVNIDLLNQELEELYKLCGVSNGN